MSWFVRAEKPLAAQPQDLEFLRRASRDDATALFARLDSSPQGLDAAEAKRRLAQDGPNLISREHPPGLLAEILSRAKNPLNALLASLAAISYALGDQRAAIVIGAMVILAIVTAFIQEHRSNQAAARLRALVHNRASVRRQGLAGDEEGFGDIPMEELVAGDVIKLSAGDMIPADVRLIETKDFFLNQSALTGEAMPVEKFFSPEAEDLPPLEARNLCFMGANVVSGYATAVVLRTGAKTFFGQLAEKIAGKRQPTAFDLGVNRFVGLMARCIFVMAPTVFLINGLTKHDWLEAMLFAVAVAVGLTPEMLPMIVTVNLAKGAIAMAREKVIVKRLHAIQNFGAMDVLCTDKTGTLTQDRIILKRHLDIFGEESEKVLHFAFLNSHFQSGLRNLLDRAVLDHVEAHEKLQTASWRKFDEIPFDFSRRRLSVAVQSPEGENFLICKGAVEEIFAALTFYESADDAGRLDPKHLADALAETEALNNDGFRVVAVAYKTLPATQGAVTLADEAGLTLIGYIAFLDPPKDSAREAIAALFARGVGVKILTGDNLAITRKICREVGLDASQALSGAQIAAMSEAELAQAAEQTKIFVKLTPSQKERVIGALHARGHVVGFLGDGINDSPALKAADVGISVDTAVDIAKDSADIILLEKNLMVLQKGVIEGRKIFANIVKYIKMGASSNFGNMFSVLGASIFLPFLPMAPIQVLTNNLLYDFSQTAIPTDNVDEEFLAAPRRWEIGNIFKFMLFIGPISSIFDYVTFAMMIFIFGAWTNPALFQTGWFVESLLTQTLIIHIIRTAKLPFIESRASKALMTTSLIICAIGIALPSSFVGETLGFVTLPPLYWPLVALILFAYAVLTHVTKLWFVRRFGM